MPPDPGKNLARGPRSKHSTARTLTLKGGLALDTTDLRRQVALSVDRSGLQQALSGLPDREIDVNPVLRDFENQISDIDAGEARARAVVSY